MTCPMGPAMATGTSPGGGTDGLSHPERLEQVMSLSTLMQALQRKYRSPQAVMEALGLDAALLDDGKDEPMSRQRVSRLAGDQGPTALGGVTASPQTMVNKTTGLDDEGPAAPPSVDFRQIAP